MYRIKFAAVVGLVLVAQTGQICLAQVSFTDMLSRVPHDANALVMFNSDQIRQSPLAKEREKHGNVNPHMFLAESVDRVVLASSLDTARLSPLWEVAIVAADEEPSMAEIADKRGGKVENFGTNTAVWLPNNSYLVSLGSKIVGIQYPADRQHAARWADWARGAKGLQFGQYLQAASKFPEAVGTDIIMALDLKHVVSFDTVRENLNDSEVLKGKDVPLDNVAYLLASIQGTTLGVKISDRISGSLRIDFAKDPSIIADFAKPLILEKLGDLQASIDDLNSWTARVEGNTVYLSGFFEIDGLRKVLSIVEPPPLPNQQPAPGEKVASPSDRDPMAYPTYDHFKATQVLVADLRKSRNPALGSSGQCAIWYERYAKKLDQLPIVGVDPELLDFTQELAVSLRGLAGTYRQVGINSAKYTANPTTEWRGAYTGVGGVYGGYGYGPGFYRTPGQFAVARKSGPSPRSTAKKLGRAEASRVRSEKFQTLDQSMAEMRRHLTEKYDMEF